MSRFDEAPGPATSPCSGHPAARRTRNGALPCQLIDVARGGPIAPTRLRLPTGLLRRDQWNGRCPVHGASLCAATSSPDHGSRRGGQPSWRRMPSPVHGRRGPVPGSPLSTYSPLRTGRVAVITRHSPVRCQSAGRKPSQPGGFEAGEASGSGQEVWEGQRHEDAGSTCVQHRQPHERWQHPAWLGGVTWASRCNGPMCSRVSRNMQEKSALSCIVTGRLARW
jgi:hypothetical protein